MHAISRPAIVHVPRFRSALSAQTLTVLACIVPVLLILAAPVLAISEPIEQLTDTTGELLNDFVLTTHHGVHINTDVVGGNAVCVVVTVELMEMF